MPNILSIFIDNIIGMLEVSGRWLTLLLQLIELLLGLLQMLCLLLLLLLEMKSMLLLLLSVCGRITGLLAFSFTLSFLIVVCRALLMDRERFWRKN
jgi:hypothetical protein